MPDPEITPEISIPHVEESQEDKRKWSINMYFFFICISTAFRSYEAGIVSSNIPLIQKQMDLGYRHVGMISASPDYGIVPSGLIAIIFFSYFPAHSLLVRGYFCISAVSFLCVLHPRMWTLLLARAMGGFCWGFAAVHYPTWINRWASQERKTLWLAINSIMLLMGILMGFIVGSSTRIFEVCGWEPLYLSEACLMLFIAVWALAFDPELVQVVDFNEEVVVSAGSTDPEIQPLLGAQLVAGDQQGQDLWLTWLLGDYLSSKIPKGLLALYCEPIFIFALTTGSLMAGTVGFILYFVTSFELEVMSWRPVVIAATTAGVFVIGPVCGLAVGGLILTRFGGYQNHVNTFTLLLGSAILVAFSTCGLYVFSSYGEFNNVGVTFFTWSLLFSGAMPTAGCNGICVSIIPGTTHIASGIQFFSQNLSKLIIPSIAGCVIDRMTIISGFNATLMTSACFGFLLSFLGYQTAVSKDRLEKLATAY